MSEADNASRLIEYHFAGEKKKYSFETVSLDQVDMPNPMPMINFMSRITTLKLFENSAIYFWRLVIVTGNIL